MKKFLVLSVALLSIISMSCEKKSVAEDQDAKTKAALETAKGKHSYAIGVNFSQLLIRDVEMLTSIGLEIDYSLIIQGIKDKMDTTKPALMNDSEVNISLQELMTEMRKAQFAKDSITRAQKAAENLAGQIAFLEKNKTEAGVAVTESGLQYTIISEGKGKIASATDTLIVHYEGKLLDGSEFDSSIKRNQPLSVILGEGKIIKGWIEMLGLMKKGQKVKAWIPSELGYGEQGSQRIYGNSLLIFEMELIDIKPAKK
ncbi:MAG: FKBP-type peptidyl-prolyl cis-trans isomerase [Fibromonadales bacterium]|nr:FKBP-type peptidyl-prolyl cis-trans isomerase [Fibromonadales bacterium]